MAGQLQVYLAGTLCGKLVQKDSGALAFSYDPEYAGCPLSFAMPVSNRVFPDKVVRAYVWGLLPEDELVRQAVGQRFDVSPRNPFALLTCIGLDCPGAVQFCLPGQDELLNQREDLSPLADDDIAKRIAAGRTGGSSWIAGDEHWSLGGQQSKFALRLQDGAWFSCGGSAATTHILKGGISRLASQALNEYVCMRLADACSIPVSHVGYSAFSGEYALVVERYDRVMDAKGKVVRLHQEDCCQALSCHPANKYTQDGGPGTAEIVQLLKSTGKNAQMNVAAFLQMLFFQYLIGAPDGHAKNYSLLLDVDGDHVLAPMYDVASMFPYVNQETGRHVRLALPIGGENRVGKMSRGKLQKLVDQCGLEELGFSESGCASLLCAYAQAIPQMLDQVFCEVSDVPGAMELQERLAPAVRASCELTLERLA